MVGLPVFAAAAMIADTELLGWRDRAGTNVQVRSFPGSTVACLHLIVGPGPYPEAPRRHGWRHLLEHLVALGPERDLDLKLEAVGAGLTADTYRDYAHFRVWGPASAGRTMVAAVAELLRPPKVDGELLLRERSVLREEAALRKGEAIAVAEAWSAAYGEGGLDPFGDLEAIASATPSELLGVWSAQFRGSNLVLVACVPDRVRDWAAWIRELVLWPRGDQPPAMPRRAAGQARRVQSRVFSGTVVAAVVPPMDVESLAQTLAAALAVASRTAGSKVVYTPTRAASLVSVVQSEVGNGLEAAVRSLQAAPNRELVLAPRRAEEWLRRQLSDPLVAGLWYGVASLQGSSAEPDNLLERLGAMDGEGVRSGLKRFGPDSAIVIAGGAR